MLRANREIHGVCGLYSLDQMPASQIWLGWFGIRPGFRRQGYGTAAIDALVDRARKMDCKELWVYTGASDVAARHFYTNLGFELLGSARDCAPGKTIDLSDIVLKLRLEVSQLGQTS